ncbi:MAG: zf-HC2 domain-containing protein, partial [Planctomycetaceae bacterium]|nr:zf-HC2 domain-containing protein [Planctomycetaceae bacterium]
MNAAGPDCHPELLERCIRGELTTDEEQLLEQHLSNCTACRDRLERLAASPRRWSDAATWLREQLEADGNQPADSSGSAMEFRVSDFIVDELRPARTEGAIGRLDDVEVLEVVGQGAMGVVLKGYQPELQRLVALKVLRPELCTSGAARKRFLREARAAASVVHPHVMPIHAVRADGRLPYLVMPFL